MAKQLLNIQHLAALVFALLFMARANAQVQANASFDPEKVETGDTFALRVLVSGGRTVPQRVGMEAWEQAIPERNILSQTDWTRSGAQWVKRYTLIAFDSATLQLPPLTVHLHLNDSVQTNPLELTVTPTPAPAETQDMDSIRDIRREATLWTDYWPWAAAAAAAVLLLIVYVRRRTKRPKPAPAAATAPPPPGPTPVEYALQRLAFLEEQRLWEKDRVGEYYADLSMILREYLERRYGILAMESTTREIAAMLKNTPFPNELKAPLDYLLQQADLAKYAEMPPPAQYHPKALDSARQVVSKSG